MIAPVTHSKLGRKIMEVGSDHSHNGTEICVQQDTVGHKTFRNTKLAPMLWTPLPQKAALSLLIGTSEKRTCN